MRRLLSVLTVAAALGLPSSPAAADDPPVAEASGSAQAPPEGEAEACRAEADEPAEHLGALAFRIVAGTSRAYPENSWLFGFGAQGEVDVAGLFEVAVGAAALLGERSTVFPIDLLLKKTLRVAPRVGFSIGLGPTVAIVVHEEQPTSHVFGGAANAGFLLWLDHDFGILVEATYELRFEDEPIHDIEGAVGVAWGL